MKQIMLILLPLVLVISLSSCTKGFPEITTPESISASYSIDYTLSDKLPQEMTDHIKAQQESVFHVTTEEGKKLFESYLQTELTQEEDGEKNVTSTLMLCNTPYGEIYRPGLS